MRVKINGAETELEAGTTVASVLQARGGATATLIVAHNDRVLHAGLWGGTALAEGDTLEIFSFVSGG